MKGHLAPRSSPTLQSKQTFLWILDCYSSDEKQMSSFGQTEDSILRLSRLLRRGFFSSAVVRSAEVKAVACIVHHIVQERARELCTMSADAQ